MWFASRKSWASYRDNLAKEGFTMPYKIKDLWEFCNVSIVCGACKIIFNKGSAACDLPHLLLKKYKRPSKTVMFKLRKLPFSFQSWTITPAWHHVLLRQLLWPILWGLWIRWPWLWLWLWLSGIRRLWIRLLPPILLWQILVVWVLLKNWRASGSAESVILGNMDSAAGRILLTLALQNDNLNLFHQGREAVISLRFYFPRKDTFPNATRFPFDP